MVVADTESIGNDIGMDIASFHANASVATSLLKSLANPHRLVILCQLMEGEKSVSELQERLGLRQPHLSQQLARLRQDGLVRTRRGSQTIYYALDSRETVQVIELLYHLFCARDCNSAPARRKRSGHKTQARPLSCTIPALRERER